MHFQTAQEQTVPTCRFFRPPSCKNVHCNNNKKWCCPYFVVKNSAKCWEIHFLSSFSLTGDISHSLAKKIRKRLTFLTHKVGKNDAFFSFFETKKWNFIALSVFLLQFFDAIFCSKNSKVQKVFYWRRKTDLFPQNSHITNTIQSAIWQYFNTVLSLWKEKNLITYKTFDIRSKIEENHFKILLEKFHKVIIILPAPIK